MNASTQRLTVAGPVGDIECALDHPVGLDPAARRGLALICHPHPLFGGTMDNKVVQTLARAFMGLGYSSLRFNFRGIGASAGTWDEGHGEIDDALAALHAVRGEGQAIVVAGFSFGAYVASQVAARLGVAAAAQRVVLIAPAVVNFAVAPVPADTLVVHGELDDVVPLQATFDWARPQSLPVTVLPGAGHFFHGQLPVLKHIVASAWAAQASANTPA